MAGKGSCQGGEIATVATSCDPRPGPGPKEGESTMQYKRKRLWVQASSKAHFAGAAIGILGGLLASASVWVGSAHACSCDPISPSEGFDRAQYVFTGKVVEMDGHTWTIDVNRVWKGAEKLASHVRLLDVTMVLIAHFISSWVAPTSFSRLWQRAVGTFTTSQKYVTGRGHCARLTSPAHVALSGLKT